MGSDLTISRNPGNILANTYVGWTAGGSPTPGHSNASPSNIADWALY